MTPDEQARAEALSRYAVDPVAQDVWVEACAWQRSQPVEITDEMVHRATDAFMQAQGELPDGASYVHRNIERALRAVLGGEGR